jgi:hypothetical protein
VVFGIEMIFLILAILVAIPAGRALARQGGTPGSLRMSADQQNKLVEVP